jgi:hypothetical protein
MREQDLPSRSHLSPYLPRRALPVHPDALAVNGRWRRVWRRENLAMTTPHPAVRLATTDDAGAIGHVGSGHAKGTVVITVPLGVGPA